MNLESLTVKLRVGGDSNDCDPWKIEKAVCYFECMVLLWFKEET